MKKIAFVTATRAEYGLLRWSIDAVQKDPELELQLIVTGAHLEPAFGETWKQIEADGYPIAAKVPMQLDVQSREGIVRSMSRCADGLAAALGLLQPDLLVVLGDRYELLPICSTATVMGIPIAHFSGGDITEGAIDNEIRNAVTMLATLHFPGVEESAQRIVRMRGSFENVWTVGEPGLEQCKRLKLLEREALSADLGLDPAKRWASLTYHPETRGSIDKDLANVKAILDFLEAQPDVECVATRANADFGGALINTLLESRAGKRLHLYSSLGQLRFLSLLKESYCCVGNSSSGIVEAPFFGTPTLDVGNRQKGRHLCANVLHLNSAEELPQAWTQISLKRVWDTWYGDGNTSAKVVAHIKEWLNK